MKRDCSPGYCQCGCGEWVGVYKKTQRDRGRVAGEPRRFATGHNTRIHPPEYYAEQTCDICHSPITKRSNTGRCVRCAMAEVGRMNALPKPLCIHCGNACPGRSYKYCSRECYLKGNTVPSGSDHHAWRGAEVGEWGARRRAQKEIPSGNCEICGLRADRHHIDRDLLNNDPANIEYLCRSHHAQRHYKEDGPSGVILYQRKSC